MGILYIILALAVFIVQIVVLVKFFQMAYDLRKLRKRNAQYYIDIAEMEAYIGNNEVAIENYKRARFKYELKEDCIDHVSGKDKTDENIAEIDKAIDKLKTTVVNTVSHLL